MIKILSIDPGTSNLGYAYSEYDPKKKLMYVKELGAMTPSKDAKKAFTKEDKNIFDMRLLNILTVNKYYNELVLKYNCHLHCSEDAFLHHMYPSSFIILSMCIHVMSNVLYNHYRTGTMSAKSAILYKFAPKHIKAVNITGTADKNDIKNAILQNKQIKINKTDIEQLDISHISDAVAIGYTMVKYLEENETIV